MLVKEHLRESLPYKRPFRQDQLLAKMKPQALLGYTQFNIKTTGQLTKQLANFQPIFEITIVRRHDIGPLVPEFAEKEGLRSQPQRVLIFSVQQLYYYYSLATALFGPGI